MVFTASIVGGSGYVGGEALRLLLDHPEIEVKQVTSERNKGKLVKFLHPNLRGKTLLKFSSIHDLKPVDVLFLALPHGISAKHMAEFKKKAIYIIDKGSDFRLKHKEDYPKFYGHEHECPDVLSEFVYGIPELHRSELKNAKYTAAAGCNATATILALYPLYKHGLIDSSRTVVEVKAGSSQSGASPSKASHHPERDNCMRSYAPTGHRHTAEIMQELSAKEIHFSATSMPLVRGILATCHVFLKEDVTENDLWKVYKVVYADEPFIRLIRDKIGLYRFPEPKLLWGTNFCDIRLKKDPDSNRVVVVSAIDNLMKGAAGQALQCMNIMLGLEETMGLEFSGLHPV